MEGRPNTLPIESEHRTSLTDGFFAAKRSADWRRNLIAYSPRLVEDFLRSAHAYRLTDTQWSLLIKELGHWAKLSGFSDRRETLAQTLAQHFEQSSVLPWAKRYIKSLSALLPNASRAVRKELLALTEDLLGIGNAKSPRPWNAEAHVRIRKLLSKSVLGIHLATLGSSSSFPPKGLEWLEIDLRTLMKNIDDLPPLDDLPAPLLQKLRAEIGHLSINASDSESWWRTVVRSWFSHAPLLPRETILQQLLGSSTSAENHWRGLLRYLANLSFNEKLSLAPQWHQLLRHINNPQLLIAPNNVLNIFEFLQIKKCPPLNAADCQVQRDFIRFRVVPALLQNSAFGALPSSLLDPFKALLTTTPPPRPESRPSQLTDTHDDPLPAVVYLANDFRTTYLTISPLGQANHRQNLSSFKVLPIYTQSVLLLSVFEKRALALAQKTDTPQQKRAMRALLTAWQEAGLSVNGKAARFISTHLDLELDARTRKIHVSSLEFWEKILLPALIDDPSEQAEDHWDIVLQRSAFAVYSAQERQSFARALAQAHQDDNLFE